MYLFLPHTLRQAVTLDLMTSRCVLYVTEGLFTKKEEEDEDEVEDEKGRDEKKKRVEDISHQRHQAVSVQFS